MRYIKLFWCIVRINLLNEVAYTTNFVLQLIQSLIDLGTALAGLRIIFLYTDVLNGWHSSQLGALLGIYLIVRGGIHLIIQPAMQQLLSDIYTGKLDFTLLKPLDAQFLASTQRINIWASVDIVLGSSVLGGALILMRNQCSPLGVLKFGAILLVGGAIIYSFWLLLASSAFWLIRIESILALFQTMYQAGRWPSSIYPAWLRFLLTFLIPVALVTTVPAEALTGQIVETDFFALLILAVVLPILARFIWLQGLKTYTGTSV